MAKQSFTNNWLLGMCRKENYSDSPSNKYSTSLGRVSIPQSQEMNSKSGEEQKKGHHVRKSPNFDLKSGAEHKKSK